MGALSCCMLNDNAAVAQRQAEAHPAYFTAYRMAALPQHCVLPPLLEFHTQSVSNQ